MKNRLTRRGFIKGSAALSATATLGGGMLGGLAGEVLAGDIIELAAVKGSDVFKATSAAVEAVGGMGRFVPKGSAVLINANTAFKHRGSIVSPDVLLSTMAMCAAAGAKKITLLKNVPDGFWKRSAEASGSRELIASTEFAEPNFKVVSIPEGLALKKAHIDRFFLEADAVLNLSVAKHHKGCEFSGILKNAMGACAHDPTCRFFHFGANTNADGWYENVDHLSQCVADLNLLRSPDLCILDAAEILTTNGPFGPGKLATPQTVVAGVDPVAVDAYGLRFLGLKPERVSMISRSEKHGLGQSRLPESKILETELA